MWENLMWAVVFGIPFAVGLVNMGLSPPDLQIARGCFIISALVLLGRVSWWLVFEHQFKNPLLLVASFGAAFLFIGIVLGGGMSWISKRELIVKEQTKRDTEIVEALKKKNTPYIGGEITKTPPDLTKAKKETHITSVSEFDPHSNGKLKVAIPGYFELSTNSSHVIMMTKEKFSGHYYASIQMGALENVRTMDLMGDISICVWPGWQGFFMWESEQSQKGWFPIKIKEAMHPSMNTVSVYQKGKYVSVFINNEFVGGFIRQKPPSTRPVGIGLKAGQAGGKMKFQSFAIWEFKQ